jgi:uncharacterized protein
MNRLIFFVSDLHGRKTRYDKLFKTIRERKPGVVLFGGDLLPHPRVSEYNDFLIEYLGVELKVLQQDLGKDYPTIGLILGNDDARMFEPSALEGERQGIWRYLHMRSLSIPPYTITGYCYVPPTPFLLKDWERYDVSRYVDPGCIPPTEGKRTVNINPDEAEYSTIQNDIATLTENADLSHTLLLFHSPPYNSFLDRAALDGMKVEHVPLDVHVGSIAIQRFIEEKQPYVTLHGHIHESSRLTGQWMQQFNNTLSFSAAWDGEELALISFELSKPGDAVRELL